MKKSYTLYGRPGSGSLAVQVALEESAAPYERVWVGREAADVERFRKINPTGKVGSSRVDLQACKLEYSIVSPK